MDRSDQTTMQSMLLIIRLSAKRRSLLHAILAKPLHCYCVYLSVSQQLTDPPKTDIRSAYQ